MSDEWPDGAAAKAAPENAARPKNAAASAGPAAARPGAKPVPESGAKPAETTGRAAPADEQFAPQPAWYHDQRIVIGGGAVLAITGGVMIARDQDATQGGTYVYRYNDRSPEDIVLTAAGAVVVGIGVVWLWKAHHAPALAPTASIDRASASVGITGTF